MRSIAILAVLLSLPLASQAGKESKKREPTSAYGVACFPVRSLEVSNGRFLLNNDFEIVYSTPMGLTLGLQSLSTALQTNESNDLCVSATQSSLDAKKVRADWPYLVIKPRR